MTLQHQTDLYSIAGTKSRALTDYREEDKVIPKVRAWFNQKGVKYKSTGAPRVAARLLLRECSTQTRNGLIGQIRTMTDAELLKEVGLGRGGLKVLREFAAKPEVTPESKPAEEQKKVTWSEISAELGKQASRIASACQFNENVNIGKVRSRLEEISGSLGALQDSDMELQNCLKELQESNLVLSRQLAMVVNSIGDLNNTAFTLKGELNKTKKWKWFK